jgi:N-methylhydantoinase A
LQSSGSPANASAVDPAAVVDLLAADVGGTFTDVIVEFSDGTTDALKLPSTPLAYEEAILEAAGELCGPGQIRRLAHGTTVATNVLLEGRGATTALITTAGFGDVLELARLRRPSLFDIRFVKPAPLVPRHLRFEIAERTAADGSLLIEASSREVTALAARLIELEVDAVAICLLNSYANPHNEHLVRKWLVQCVEAEERPMIVTASSDIQREIREFERTSTAVINAYVAPAVSRYLDRLGRGIASRHGTNTVQIMQSNGSLIPRDLAARFPCRLIESGPAAGVLAAADEIDDLNGGNAIAFDMGGTTAKAALIERGRPFEAVQLEVGGSMNHDGVSMSGSGYVIRAPSLDISEVGAGGGSIVWLDRTGAPRVGPRSAGADPGPACYARGGSEPTVTDANLVLGFLGATGIAGGRVPLRVDLAEAAIAERVAAPLDLDVVDAAWGIHVLANVGMEVALRSVSVERGRSPADYVLVAYGGAGPMHAATMAMSFGMSAVLIPPRAGLLCAHGLTLAGIRRDGVIAYPPAAGIDGDVLRTLTEELKASLGAEEGGETGTPAEELSWRLAMRYRGQPTELMVDFDPDADLRGDVTALLSRRFVAEHLRTYGYSDAHAPLQIVSVRAVSTRPADNSRGDGHAPVPWRASPTAESAARRPVFFGPDEGWVDTAVTQDRFSVRDLTGPLIVEEPDATVVVPPRWKADCDDRGRLHMTREPT